MRVWCVLPLHVPPPSIPSHSLSSSTPSIIQPPTPPASPSSCHSLDWTGIRRPAIHRSATPPLLLTLNNCLLEPLVRPRPRVDLPPLNRQRHTQPCEGTSAINHGEQNVALLQRLWHASQPHQHNAGLHAVFCPGLHHNSPKRLAQCLLVWPAVRLGIQHELGSQHMGHCQPDRR